MRAARYDYTVHISEELAARFRTNGIPPTAPSASLANQVIRVLNQIQIATAASSSPKGLDMSTSSRDTTEG